MNEEKIRNCFTEVEEGVNAEFNKVTVKCFDSTNNAFSMDCEGNLVVNSIRTREEVFLHDIIDAIYPVGSLYFSMNEVNPETFLTGTWERIQNQFLLASSSTYPVGTTGGSIGHHHTLNNAYARIGCARGVMYYHRKYGTAINYNQTVDDPSFSHTDRQANQNVGTSLDGRTDNTSLLPPYIAVSIWKRVA